MSNQTTINIEKEDKQAIIDLAAKHAPTIKQRKISQAQMVHIIIETFKETQHG